MQPELSKVSQEKLKDANQYITNIDKRALQLEQELLPIAKNLLKKISKQFISLFNAYDNYTDAQIYSFIKNYEGDLITLYRTGFDMAGDEFGSDLRNKLLGKKASNVLRKAIEYTVKDEDITEIDKNYYKEWVVFENNQSEIESAFVIQSLTNEIQATIQKAQKDTSLYFTNLDEQINQLIVSINNIENGNVVYSDKYTKLKEYKKELKSLQETREEQRSTINTIVTSAFIGNIDKVFITHSKSLVDTIINVGEAKARNLEYNVIKAQRGTVKKNSKIYSFANILEEAFWGTVGDGRVRITHATANGQLKVNDVYIVGGYTCRHPRDTALPIQERARCRCREVLQLK